MGHLNYVDFTKYCVHSIDNLSVQLDYSKKYFDCKRELVCIVRMYAKLE